MKDAADSIRVLQIVTGMLRCGLETMLMNYYRNMDREKVQFDFLEHRQEYTEYDEEIMRMGGRVYKLPELNPLSYKYVGKTKRFFREHPEYKIVHAHMNCMSGLPLSYAKRAGVPVRIAHSHSISDIKNLKYPIKRYYRRVLGRAATDRMACGRMAGEWLFGRNEFLVLNNAIHTEQFIYQPQDREKARRAYGIGEHEYVIGHVGRFFYPKNHKFLIEVFLRMKKMIPDSRLLLVGEGPLQNKICEKVCRYGLKDSVIFAGNSDKVWKMLSAMDAFVMPSLYEGLSVALIEAQASGIKCFISDAISKEAVLTDDVTVLGLEEDAGKWAEKICRISRSYHRKNRKEDIIRAGYDITANAQWLENYYIGQWNGVVI